MQWRLALLWRLEGCTTLAVLMSSCIRTAAAPGQTELTATVLPTLAKCHVLLMATLDAQVCQNFQNLATHQVRVADIDAAAIRQPERHSGNWEGGRRRQPAMQLHHILHPRKLRDQPRDAALPHGHAL